MNLHDLTEPVRAILEGAGLNYQQTIRMWNYIDEGVDTPMLDGAAARIAESILSNHLEEQGDLTTGHMEDEEPPWYCTTFATGCPLVYEGKNKLEALIAASAALAKEGGIMKWPKTEKEIDALLDEPVMEYTEEEIERHVDRIVAKIAVIRRAKTAAKFVRVVRRPLPTNPGAPKP